MAGTTSFTVQGDLSGQYGPGGLLPLHLAPLIPGDAASSGEDAIEVLMSRLDVPPEAVQASAALLSEAERDRARRFAFERDRHRFIVARARLRELLGERLCVRPDSVELEYGAHGKPALAPRFAASGLRFNVSHCGDVAAHAFSRGREIGVDVEAVRKVPDGDEIAARFFSRRESEDYLALDPGDRPVGFFNCWTRKEAFIKAIGDGLSYPLDRFDVSLLPGQPARILRVEGRPGNDCGWTLHSFLPEPGLIGAVAARKLDPGSTGAGTDRIVVRWLSDR